MKKLKKQAISLILVMAMVFSTVVAVQISAGAAAENEPRLSRLVVRHAGLVVDISDIDETEQSMTFAVGEPFTFEVEIENGTIVENVYVISEQENGAVSRIQADYNTGRGLFIAEGFFNDDPDYIPGQLSVEFTEDIAHLFDEIEIDFNEDIDFSEAREILEPEWRDATITEVGNTTTIVLDDEQGTEFEVETQTEYISVEIDDLLAQGFQRVEDAHGNFVFARMTGGIAYEGDEVEFEVVTPIQARRSISSNGVQPAFILTATLATVKIGAKVLPAVFPKVAGAARFVSGAATAFSLGKTVSGGINRHRAGVDPRLNTFQTLSQIALTMGGGSVGSTIITSLAGYIIDNLHRINLQANVPILRHLQSLGFDGRGFAGGGGVIAGRNGVFLAIVDPARVFTFTIQNNQARITGFAGLVEHLVIPSTLGGHPVTEIGSSAFRNSTALRSVVIPDSVVEIRSWAFENCTNLTSVTLSRNLDFLGVAAFRNTAITSIEIPRSLESTGFRLSGDGVFGNNPHLRNVTFQAGTTRIAIGLFAETTGLETINIPDTVTSIGNSAFRDNTALRSVVIPDSVTSIGSGAFAGCINLEQATLSENITTIPNSLFSGAIRLRSVNIPAGVTSIGNSAFNDCRALESIELPVLLRSIGNSAFRNNDSLTRVDIPKNVTTIGDSAFYDSDSLTTVTLPNRLTSLGANAFRSCEELAYIDFGYGLRVIPDSAFRLNPSLRSVTLPESLTTIAANAFAENTELRDVYIPESVTSIQNNSFSFPNRMTVRGIAGSFAETHANNRGMTFVATTPNQRPICNDAHLEVLRLNVGTLSPAFREHITEYTVTVPNATNRVTVTATASSTWATVTGAGSVNLDEGENVVEIVVTAEDGTTTITYRITITREAGRLPQAAPAAPTLSSRTHNSVTLNAIAGAEFRRGNGAWQTSPIFTGLSPNTTYSFTARMRETATHNASPASVALSVTTTPLTTPPTTQPPTTRPPTTTPIPPTSPTVANPCARGHNPVANGNRNATFFATGLRNRTVCSRCNVVINRGQTIGRRTLARPRITLRATGNRRVRVTTNRVPNANRYQFQFRRQGQRSWQSGGTVSGRNRNIARLTRGSNYQFRVRAARVQGRNRANSGWSATRRIRVR